MYAPSLSPRASSAAKVAVMRTFDSSDQNDGPNGTPTEMYLISNGMLNQAMIWT